MGLDQYLTRKTYIGAKHRAVEGSIALKNEGVDVDVKKISSIEEEIFYWRKANQIHKWFVDNVQEGKDDCQEYDVKYEQLEKLLSDCKRVKANIGMAPAILPSQSGFFFGQTEYDEHYMNQIYNTIIFLENYFANHPNDKENYNISIHYRASW